MIDFKTDKNAEPNDFNLSNILGDSFTTFKHFESRLKELEVDLLWRFYKDGGWLAKITRKNKTLIWGWPDEGFFGTNFIFSNKPHLREGVFALDISDKWKVDIEETPNGSYFSIQIEVREEADLTDVYTMIAFKMKAK
jgi:hypothetical protein